MTENRLTLFKMPVQGLGIDGLEKKTGIKAKEGLPRAVK